MRVRRSETKPPRSRSRTLAVITTPGLTLPETTDRAAWTRDHHRAALICSLGWQLAVRDAWASQAPTTVWVDEMGVLMHGVASIGASIKRASTDSRKVNLAAGFASQTGEAFRRIDPDLGLETPTWGVSIDPRDGAFLIATPQGVMAANKGDWIIRDENGEFYSFTPFTFEATYEPVEDEQD